MGMILADSTSKSVLAGVSISSNGAPSVDNKVMVAVVNNGVPEQRTSPLLSAVKSQNLCIMDACFQLDRVYLQISGL